VETDAISSLNGSTSNGTIDLLAENRGFHWQNIAPSDIGDHVKEDIDTQGTSDVLRG
jgi:hypothetical protein